MWPLKNSSDVLKMRVCVCSVWTACPLQPRMCSSMFCLNSTRGRSESNQWWIVDTQGESLGASVERTERSWVYWQVCMRCVTAVALRDTARYIAQVRQKTTGWVNTESVNGCEWKIYWENDIRCTVLIIGPENLFFSFLLRVSYIQYMHYCFFANVWTVLIISHDRFLHFFFLLLNSINQSGFIDIWIWIWWLLVVWSNHTHTILMKQISWVLPKHTMCIFDFACCLVMKVLSFI